MKVVLAPDSFKGTVSATDAVRALADGWRVVRPSDELVAHPMSDGGEGTLETIAAACPGATVHTVPGCTGPDGRRIPGRFGMLPDGSAVVDMATASGLPLSRALDALTATSRGTGELIAAALDAGATRLLVGLGGSASTDGGTGILSALGARFTDRHGRPLPDGGGFLSGLAHIDVTDLRPPPPGGVLLLTDVRSPLLGPLGAAAVYGPQKGADATGVAWLDHGLARLCDLLGGAPDAPGAGAAGGAAYGLATAWGARITPGAAAVADFTGLDRVLDGADLVITGEGRYDGTSHLGKVVGEILARAERARVPARIVAGESAADTALTLARIAGGRIPALRDARHWLRRAGADLARDVDDAEENAR